MGRISNRFGWTAALAILVALPASAQTHKVEAPPQNVVRAVGVYEWTGDLAKPTASRLIPVSLFINGRLQDAGVYMARPVPLSLLTGNLYELQKSGLPQGTLELAYARHLIANQNSATTFDDGWFGYGKFAARAAPKKNTNLRASTTPIRLDGTNAEDDDKPHFSSRSAIPGTGGSANPRPGSAPAASPSDDPDRPTMKKRGADDSASETVPGDDADRPTLRKRSGSDKKDRPRGDEPEVEKVGSGLNDPDRPTIHRGKPVNAMSEDDIPKLVGLPPEKQLHQIIAVSDAADRSPHDFTREWEGPDERNAVLTKLEAEARTQLAAYGTAHATATAASPARPAPETHRPGGTARRTPAKRTAPQEPPPAPITLVDEDLRGYELSYNGTPTFVYTAHTDGTGSARKDVTLVAQMNPKGDPEYAIKSVTDEAHLDQTPRMHLVDAVDADASNRASLLFELKAQNARQFALYRVIGARAEQIFTTGTTQ
jgi:cytochrome c553